jgi:K+ transporter
MQRATTAAIVVIAVAASVLIFLAVDAGSHSVSDTLYGAVVPVGFVWLGALGLLATMRLLAGRFGKSG